MEIRKYFTKSLLIEYNKAAIREKRNRQLKEEFVDKLDENGIYLVVYNMLHNTPNEIRVQIMFDTNVYSFLDMSSERFEILPIVTFYDDGSFKIQSEEDARKKFPYNGREWIEKTIKVPYRGEQGKFRDKVLDAYDYKCAICDINEPRILEAAHIVDVSSGGNDSVNNGICLCVNHHIAFDKGILKISQDGEILVCSPSIKVDKTVITYPKNKDLHPFKQFLKQKIDSFNN